MSLEAVQQFFQTHEGEVLVLEQSSATVAEAAQAVGCQPCQIAKTMSFFVAGQPVLVVLAGDARIDNPKYKAVFGEKAKMIPPDQVEDAVGHAPGGVCPFVIKPGVKTYLDESLRRFETVYPAAGSDHSAVRQTLPQLEVNANCAGWIDVSKLP